MPRHRRAGPILGDVASAPRWSTGPPWVACSNRWPCRKSRPRPGAVLAPGSALAADSGPWVRSAVAPPFPSSPAHLSSARAMPRSGPGLVCWRHRFLALINVRLRGSFTMSTKGTRNRPKKKLVPPDEMYRSSYSISAATELAQSLPRMHGMPAGPGSQTSP